MRAMLSVGAGDRLIIGDAPEPSVGSGEILIEVAACGINYPDVLMVADRYQVRPPRPFSPGGEVSGRVVAVGKQAEFSVGDRVIGLTSYGGLAERVSAPANRCVRIPDGMSWTDAAGFLTTLGTSYHALKQRARIAAGETLLVIGAAGGVGLAAVQLGALLGAKVIAAASSQEKLDFAMAHGAESGFAYGVMDEAPENQAALADLFKKQGFYGTVDVVFDPAGGAYTLPLIKSLGWRGRYLVVGFAAGISSIPLNMLLLQGRAALGVYYGMFTREERDANAQNTRELLDLYEHRGLRPVISEILPFERSGEALARLANRQVRGKIVVTLS